MYSHSNYLQQLATTHEGIKEKYISVLVSAVINDVT